MSSLMQRIEQSMSARPSSGPQVGQQSIADVLRAKGGKAQTGAPTPQASSLLQDTAQQQAQDQLRQIDMTGQLAKQGLQAGFAQEKERAALGQEQLAADKRMARSSMQAAEQQAAAERDAREAQARQNRSAEENMRMDAINNQATIQLRQLATQRDVSLDNIFSEFERSNKELQDRRDASQLEQLGFTMAMSDQSYMDEISRIGRQRGLDNDLQFKTEIATMTLGNELSAMADEMSWGRVFNATRREWEEEIAKISLDSAAQIARAEIKAANTQAMWQAVGTVAGAGIKYASSQGAFSNEQPQAEPPSAGGQGGQTSMNWWENF